jgi:biopolymer transport protein ExbD
MNGGGSFGPGGVKKARIEIIPLIDIIFFLLATFIMVSLSMTKNQGLQVALPSASTAQSLGDQQDAEKTVTLSVNGQGETFFNKEKVTPAQLAMKLQTYKNSVRDPRVVVTGDAGADFQTIVKVLDETRRIGISKVGISTDKK